MKNVNKNFKNRVEAVVSQIPEGRVMTYGQIAALSGNPLAARIVGGIAHFGNPDLPWHRVVNKRGGLASGYPGGKAAHKTHLGSERILVANDYRVDVGKLLWQPHEKKLVVSSWNLGKDIAPETLTTNYELLTTGPLVAIVGETASGKSDLALQIAKKYEGELICADSWTVYKGFDIGTAKPRKQEQRRTPHHLLDVADPTKGFSAAIFKKLASKSIADVQERGKLPILVGGTGLYVDAIIFDYGFLPKGDASKRELLNSRSLEELIEQAQKQMINLEGIDKRNKRRIIRAIETNGQRPARKTLHSNTLLLGKRLERDQLQIKIEQRVDNMLSKGLEQEVANLARRYGWEAEPMKGIGYQQWQDYFSGTQTLETTRMRIIQASLGLAKRQRTWFKRNEYIQWCESPEQAEKAVEHFLHNNLIQ